MDDERIRRVEARRVLDSRGHPTIEAIITTGRVRATAIAPSGKSTGSREAHELRDGGKRWQGMDVSKALKKVQLIDKRLKGMSIFQQEDIDTALRELDGTPFKEKLGGNLLISVSMAAMRAAAFQAGTPLYQWVHLTSYVKREARLPVPFANVLNGGVHAANPLKLQEFMITPVRAKSLTDAVRAVSETYHTLRQIVKRKYGSDCVGDEGGFAPAVTTAEEALSLLEEARDAAGWKREVRFAIDAAASEFYHAERDAYEIAPGVWKTPDELIDWYKSLARSFNVYSLEDPYHENAPGWYARLRKELRGRTRIVADDLTVSQPARVADMLRRDAFDILLLKPNQAGLMTEALIASMYAVRNGKGVMVSHRSGESEDAFIADLATGLGVGMIKIGAPARGERTAKYNQLLRLEDEFNLPYGLPPDE